MKTYRQNRINIPLTLRCLVNCSHHKNAGKTRNVKNSYVLHKMYETDTERCEEKTSVDGSQNNT